MPDLFTMRGPTPRTLLRGVGIFACAVASLLAPGCATNQAPFVPLDRRYQPPAAGEASATLAGTQRHSAVLDDYTAFVSSVDGKCVMSGRAGWNDALPIAAGAHRITIHFVQGLSEAYVKLPLQAEAGHAYKIGYLDGGGTILGPGSYMDFWIDDLQSNQHVSPAIRSAVTVNREGTDQLCAELFRITE